MLTYSLAQVCRKPRRTCCRSLALWTRNETCYSSISILNMVFHGVSNHVIKQGNTLTTPKLKNRNGGLKKFDKIIANMPFSVGYEDESLTLRSRFQYGMPNPLPSKRADFLFVQHMLSSLKANGIIVTVCSTGILFREGKELGIRQSLIENDLIQGRYQRICLASLEPRWRS